MFKFCRALTRRWTPPAALACALLSTACSTAPAAARLTLPTTLREPCPKPVSPLLTQADEDAYLIRLAEALVACDGRRQAVVDAVDAAQKETFRMRTSDAH